MGKLEEDFHSINHGSKTSTLIGVKNNICQRDSIVQLTIVEAPLRMLSMKLYEAKECNKASRVHVHLEDDVSVLDITTIISKEFDEITNMHRLRVKLTIQISF